MLHPPIITKDGLTAWPKGLRIALWWTRNSTLCPCSLVVTWPDARRNGWLWPSMIDCHIGSVLGSMGTCVSQSRPKRTSSGPVFWKRPWRNLSCPTIELTVASRLLLWRLAEKVNLDFLYWLPMVTIEFPWVTFALQPPDGASPVGDCHIHLCPVARSLKIRLGSLLPLGDVNGQTCGAYQPESHAGGQPLAPWYHLGLVMVYSQACHRDPETTELWCQLGLLYTRCLETRGWEEEVAWSCEDIEDPFAGAWGSYFMISHVHPHLECPLTTNYCPKDGLGLKTPTCWKSRSPETYRFWPIPRHSGTVFFSRCWSWFSNIWGLRTRNSGPSWGNGMMWATACLVPPEVTTRASWQANATGCGSTVGHRDTP